ncbi:hypothetical protein JOM56_006522 [Amanita muscaria]
MPLPTTHHSRQNNPKRQGATPANNPDHGRDQLSKLMSDYGVDDEEADIPELLNRLEATHGVANGVEGKLDDILNNLDTLLESMEHGHQSIIPPTLRPVSDPTKVVKT